MKAVGPSMMRLPIKWFILLQVTDLYADSIITHHLFVQIKLRQYLVEGKVTSHALPM